MIGLHEHLYFFRFQRQVLVGFHFLDGVVDVFAVSTEVLDSVFDLLFGTIGEVDESEFGEFLARRGDDHHEQSVFEFAELGLGILKGIDHRGLLG
jgi:hypothetical protein